MRLKDKVAVITGGGSGIGKATALKFAHEGARVVVAEQNEDHGHRVVDEIISWGVDATFIRTDVSVFEDVQAAVALAAEKYGRLDIMFNNAGIGLYKPLLDYEPADYDRVVKVNQYGVLHGILAAGRKMRDLESHGVIINTASVFAFMASPGVFGYHASKGAVGMVQFYGRS